MSSKERQEINRFGQIRRGEEGGTLGKESGEGFKGRRQECGPARI
jgi:hypothetical protein